jgi:hypothetical protein
MLNSMPEEHKSLNNSIKTNVSYKHVTQEFDYLQRLAVWSNVSKWI